MRAAPIWRPAGPPLRRLPPVAPARTGGRGLGLRGKVLGQGRRSCRGAHGGPPPRPQGGCLRRRAEASEARQGGRHRVGTAAPAVRATSRHRALSNRGGAHEQPGGPDQRGRTSAPPPGPRRPGGHDLRQLPGSGRPLPRHCLRGCLCLFLHCLGAIPGLLQQLLGARAAEVARRRRHRPHEDRARGAGGRAVAKRPALQGGRLRSDPGEPLQSAVPELRRLRLRSERAAIPPAAPRRAAPHRAA
mmetsp:Transcript_112267/g.358338  ORF Transcript_112267/g.358338 Transcript_112267/m.358338 type:complete len:245 (+) Transcript_112267:600-1334(+)